GSDSARAKGLRLGACASSLPAESLSNPPFRQRVHDLVAFGGWMQTIFRKFGTKESLVVHGRRKVVQKHQAMVGGVILDPAVQRQDTLGRPSGRHGRPTRNIANRG